MGSDLRPPASRVGLGTCPPSARSVSPIPPDRTSVVVAPPAHGTSHGSKHHQDQADNDENNPDAPQNGNLCDESDYQQDDAEDDHLYARKRHSTSAARWL